MAQVLLGKKQNIANREPTASRSEKSKTATCEASPNNCLWAVK